MTFSKSKLIVVWVGLFIALGIALAGMIISGNDEALGETLAIGALCLAGVSMLLGLAFVRCPACGRILIRAMRPWKPGCCCPYCRTNIKLI